MARRKVTPQELQRLAEHFRTLGARDPEDWARSDLEEGIPQYVRLVFLRQAWTNIVAEDDTTWIAPLIHEAERRPRDPGAGAGPALKRMLTAGVLPEDIAEVVRVMQWNVLAAVAYQLSDSGVVEYPSEDLPRVNWTLFEVDQDGQPLRPIEGLHESVLETDPAGREMRPKSVGREG